MRRVLLAINVSDVEGADAGPETSSEQCDCYCCCCSTGQDKVRVSDSEGARWEISTELAGATVCKPGCC